MRKWKCCGAWGVILMLLLQFMTLVFPSDVVFAADDVVAEVKYNVTWKDTHAGATSSYSAQVTFSIYQSLNYTYTVSGADRNELEIAIQNYNEINRYSQCNNCVGWGGVDDVKYFFETAMTEEVRSALMGTGSGNVEIAKVDADGTVEPPIASDYRVTCGASSILYYGNDRIFTVGRRCAGDKTLTIDEAVNYVYDETVWALSQDNNSATIESVGFSDDFLARVKAKFSSGRYYITCDTTNYNRIRVGYSPSGSVPLTSGNDDWLWDNDNGLLFWQSVEKDEYPDICNNQRDTAVGIGGLSETLGIVTQYATEAGREFRKNFDASGEYSIDFNALSVAWTETAGVEDENDLNDILDAKFNTCHNAAGVFSWIICPLMDMLREAVEGLFGLIEDMLVVDTRILDESGETHTGWSSFRDVANVVMIVLFMAIIISQVTGFGIDNYGIKKMLPRLIVIAILINLSFIICQLAVDVSNIVGSSVYGFFESMAGRMDIVANNTQGLTVILTLVIGILVLAIAMSAGIMLLPLLLGLLSALIASLFMFMLLGIRQAAVAIFVVLAPLAFAMNMLPNTAGLFKKWWNIFKTLLLLYPICGLVMGGSLYGSVLVLSLSGSSRSGVAPSTPVAMIFTFVGFVLLVAPIFFIPKLVKGAFDGLGKIGGAVAGLGGKLSGAARSGVRDSESFKSHEARRQKDDKLMKAGDYTGKNRLRRWRSGINAARAKTNIPILRSNVGAELRGKRYNHMNEAGEYDGAVASRDENMQMQGVLGGSITQSNGRKYREEDEYREEEYVDIAGDGTVKKRRIPTGKKIRVADGYNSTTDKNVIESHTGNMVSANSRNTFDKFIGDMNAKDIKDAGPEFVGIRGMYQNMATLDSSMSTSDQARAMYDGFVSSYKSLGRSDASAQEDAKQQLGFDATGFGTVSQAALDAFKYEARRRTSEINKREGKANTEEIVGSLKEAMGDGGMGVPH